MSILYKFFKYLNRADFFLVKSNNISKYPYKTGFNKRISICNKHILRIFDKITFITRVSYRKQLVLNNMFLMGFLFFWRHLRYWFMPVTLFVSFFYFSICVRSAPFLKLLFEWFIISNVAYWLISGFVFFIKKYRYNRFTSAIQRFWRRSFIIFWLIESSLFIVFIYLLFNSSQEPVYAFDLIQLQKQRLYSWKFFIFKSFFVFLILMLSYTLLVSIKWNIFTKYSSSLLIITAILTYIVWLEFYQFFYVINWYGEISWLFDLDDKVWYAESTFKRSRIVNHYITICVIAKFWHIIYIYIFWVFFILRAIEQKGVSYVLLSANFQNFLILYIMNWLLMYPWLKFLFRKLLTLNHKSFYEFRRFTISGIYCDFFLFSKSFFKTPYLLKNFNKSFYYGANINLGVHSHFKEFIKVQLVEALLYIQ